MRTFAIAFIALTSSTLFAQRTDTTEVKNGMYGVYKVDGRGRALNPMAVHDTSGRLLRHISYKHGLLEGPVIHYDSLGRKTWTQQYKKGQKHGREVYFYPDGTVMISQTNRNGNVHGQSTTYHPNGRVEWTKSYRDGRLHGERTLRDSTGAMVNGEYVSYYPFDRGQYTVTCSNGRPQGKVVAKLKGGQVAFTGNYADGYPDGEFIFFSPDGTILRKEFYEKGKFVRSTQRGKNGAHTPEQYEPPLPEER